MKLEIADTPTEEKIEMDQEEIKPTGESAETEIAAPGFTPGEWRVKESKVPGYERNIDVIAGNLRICEVTGGSVSNPVVLAQVRANARLLAAAPALYEALIAIDKAMDNGDLVWNRKRYADSDPYDPAAVKLCAALSLVDGNQETK